MFGTAIILVSLASAFLLLFPQPYRQRNGFKSQKNNYYEHFLISGFVCAQIVLAELAKPDYSCGVPRVPNTEGLKQAFGALSRILRQGQGRNPFGSSLPSRCQEMDQQRHYPMYLLFVSYYLTPYDLPLYGTYINLIHPSNPSFVLNRLGTPSLQDQNDCRCVANIHLHYSAVASSTTNQPYVT